MHFVPETLFYKFLDISHSIIFILTSASLSMPIQQTILKSIIHTTPKALNSKFPSNICMSFKFNNDLNDKQNPSVFMAAEIMLANANKRPIDPPNSGPIDLEIIK